tara:strand:+ start:1944 stop:2972 length:1029 start_codon:yes stop_codon:yes gene_type:complete
MKFNKILSKALWLLIPISFAYSLISYIRNVLFDLKIFNQKKYDVKIIGIGNLSTGGTGKSVLVDYLVKFLVKHSKISVLSRGYNRKSKGIYEANKDSNFNQIGDEPMMLYSKHKNLRVVVAESRIKGMDYMIKTSDTESIYLLDDAFQHRSIFTGLSILLTTYRNPFFKDFILPYGNLRENKKGYKRANIIIVTKCPINMSLDQKSYFINKIKPKIDQKIFFSSIKYSDTIINKNETLPIKELEKEEFLLVSGIADSYHLRNHLKYLKFDYFDFSDHHNYSKNDLNKILDKSNGKLILTTEKDYVKLSVLIKSKSLFYIPIDFIFEKKEKKDFEKTVINYVS